MNVAHSECIILIYCPTFPSFQTKGTVFFESVNYCDLKPRSNEKYNITFRVLFQAKNWVKNR